MSRVGSSITPAGLKGLNAGLSGRQIQHIYKKSLRLAG